MRETKTANGPAPWPQRFSAESLAPGVRRLLGTPRRGREGEQGAGQQPPARAEEVQQDIRKGARRCGGRRAGAGRRRFSAPWEEEARCGRSRTRAMRLSRSGQVKGSRCILGPIDGARSIDAPWSPALPKLWCLYKQDSPHHGSPPAHL
ncbi:hypothetical protein PVAP13_6KG026600 [Panicum virgatum]|uniref:Uncharacterized protein n=1 Tax=Panicum virgatum TaxID=38727 RepID=A0A8T0R6S2_PANVG|nr:hypothetical protein PVAP13_6KG026600 [Panicum virgatum]